jgi:hypothetical protein
MVLNDVCWRQLTATGAIRSDAEMNALLEHIEELADQELYSLCEAIEVEIHRREELSGELPDSARKRAVEREQSYRRRNSAFAPPVRAVGIGKTSAPRRAA